VGSFPPTVVSYSYGQYAMPCAILMKKQVFVGFLQINILLGFWKHEAAPGNVEGCNCQNKNPFRL